MIYPLKHIEISSHYGHRIPPTSGASSFHNGVDFAAPSGTPVYAPGSGIVDNVFFNSSGGNQIILKHSRGRQTGFAHLSKTFVIKGQPVKQGDLIGEVGSTGTSTGPHLHYTFKKNGEYVDPLSVYHGLSNRTIALIITALVAIILFIYLKFSSYGIF